MNIIIHYPSTEENCFKLQEQCAKVYANAVIDKLNKLNCSDEQKTTLLNYLKQ